MKRRILITIALTLVTLCASAQVKRIFLFEQFSDAKVKLIPRGITAAKMNYDAANGKMYFMQDGEMMELTNISSVESVSWGQRTFIPYDKRFREIYTLGNGIVEVDWVLKDLVVGRKGAYGMRTEGNVQNLRLFDFDAGSGVPSYTGYDAQNTYANDILKRKNENSYYITINGEKKRVKYQKNLEKLFPDHVDEIRSYAKDKKLEFSDPVCALELIDFCLGFLIE